MLTVSYKFSKSKIQEMQNNYQDYLRKTPPYASFQAKMPGVVITAYNSGKVVFQGELAVQTAEKWGYKIDQKQTSHNIKFLNDSHIGSDESGTGDYFGPITTSAIFVPQNQMALLKEIGVQDSKKLTDEKILELTTYILAMELPYSSVVLHNDKYNQLQAQGWTQGKMKAMLHQTAINNVVDKIDTRNLRGILIDQFCLPNIFIKHIKSEGMALQAGTEFMTKAEDYSIAVASASIIARARYVQEMNKLSEMLHMDLIKGASKKVDQQIAKIIKQFGKEKLNSVAKVHFANTQKAQKLL